MRLALISDIHGNDTALERVLTAIGDDGAEAIVCLGDVAGTGPQPHAVLERLRGTGAPVVMGNVDWYILHADSVTPPANEAAARFWDIDRWCAEQITDADLAYIAGFVSTFEADLGEGASALCYHGSPGSFEDSITSTTPNDELEAFLAGHGHAVFAGGHTHFAMARRFGSALVINPGSVGMAYDRTHPSEDILFAPWAEYALLTFRGGSWSVDLRRVEYDKSVVVEAVRASGMPHAEWLAAEWAR
jgi:predicted phosphodiesterase